MKTYQRIALVSAIMAAVMAPSFGCKFKPKEPKEKTVLRMEKNGDGIVLEESEDKYKIKGKKDGYEVEIEIPKKKSPERILEKYPNQWRNYKH